MQTKLTNGDTIETYTDATGTYSAAWQIGNKTGDCYQKGDEVTSETADDERRITTKDDYDRYSSVVCLGDLTEKQYKALTEVARLSPGYNFVVTRYAQTDEAKGSSATHVLICKQGNDNNHVGLVGKNTVQYYDQDKATKAVVKRVAHRVYRFSGFTMV